jgi:FkbM family methyltransferase
MFMLKRIGRTLSYCLKNGPDHPLKLRLIVKASWLLGRVPMLSGYGVWLYENLYDITNYRCIIGNYDTVPEEIARLEPGMCFIDIGANCGLFTLMASKQVGPSGLVIALEPSPREFSQLCMNIALNDCTNVLPFRFAVGEETETIRFAMNTAGHSGSNAVATDGNGNIDIHCLNFADFPAIHRFIAGRRTVIKIDVEGYEMRVAKGIAGIIADNPVETVIVEIDESHLNKFGASRNELYDLFDRMGFMPTRNEQAGHYDEVFHRSGAPRSQSTM